MPYPGLLLRSNPGLKLANAFGVFQTDAVLNLMSEESSDRPFVFSVVEDDGENVTIEVSEEDYQTDLAAGIDEDALLRPGRYKMKRGGFLARHLEFRIDQKRRA